MNVNEVLRDARLNAERILRFLGVEFNYEFGQDMDLDDSFKEAAKSLALQLVELDNKATRKNLPDQWMSAPSPPTVEKTREEQVAEVRARANQLGYRLVLRPPPK
jgi:hypothetical protein